MEHCEESHAFIQHLVSEHRRLDSMLHEARRTIDALRCEPGGAGCVIDTLQTIRAELQQHFGEEEAGGCLDEAVSRCPNLSSVVQKIEAEHPRLLSDVDSLIARALHCTHKGVEGIEFQTAFERFCCRMHAHERAENYVLSQAFGVNVNGDEPAMNGG